MYRITTTLPVLIGSSIRPVFESGAFLWIAPDQLLNARSPEQKAELRQHAKALVQTLERKQIVDADPTFLPSLNLMSSFVYLRLLNVPEPFSHIYMKLADLKSIEIPCPPYDDFSNMHTLFITRGTRMQSVERE